MEKTLMVGNASCFTEKVNFLFKLAGFDLVFATDIEEAINLIEIKKSFGLLVIPRSEILSAAPGYFGFFNNPDRKIKILIVENTDLRIQNEINFEEFFKSEGISFCSSEDLIEEVKRIFGRN